ncbi:uncharacterized protein MAM_05597 [Metarhizium album ARSEF 1941]|uniref:Uncharacterized protein n=1 Tax=Metarhizium album (strain ARSEF 1941) TaxID=1081103 RepID=A0A0B2WSQ7_METAS|nr:uncharacterized protein MAM_05597 [Metarhizium album ARSEF 1941]KHN96654.1 hypothetical protein MAM_05597 [Metarhizium album ARSEF 1941]
MSSPRRLLLLPLPLLPLSPTVLAAETSRRSSNLTVQLAEVVPACAEDCFISFLDANYGLGRCDDVPSLEDLCSTDGNTGFTVGEGAVQCMAAEQRLGACSGKEADSSAMYRAYQMCSDQPGALTPTHAVITATLAVPSSGRGPVSYPAPWKTSTGPSARPHLPSTRPVDTHAPTSTPSSGSDTTLRTAVVSTTTETTGTSSSSSEPAAAAASGGSLTPVQKAGIAVGVIGFAAVAIGLLLLFRLHRAKGKRRGHAPLAGSPRRRDSWGYKSDESRRQGSSEPSWMASPVGPPDDAGRGLGGAQSPSPRPQTQGPRPKPPPPRAYNRSSWRPSLIGVALSPSHARRAGHITSAPPPRPVSKLLPAKPSLSPDIPRKPPTPPPKHTPPPPASSLRSRPESRPSPEHRRITSRPPVLPKLQIPRGHDLLHVPGSANKPRESTMTEFEEDGRHSSTVLSSGTQRWNAPSAAPPSSAATHRVADGRGNWMPGDSSSVQAAELEGTTPLGACPELSTGMAVFPAVTGAPAEQPGQGAAKRRAHRRSSSAPLPPHPAQQSVRVVTEPLTALNDGQDDAVPRPLFSDAGGNPRSATTSAAARHSSGRNLTKPRVASGDGGITNISVSSDEHREPHPPRVSQANLSPVTESPRPASGAKSPVSYPKIPGRENTISRKETCAQPLRMPILYKSAHHRTASGGIGSSVAMLTVGSLAPNPNPNTPQGTNRAAGTATLTTAPAPSASEPVVPSTSIVTASPYAAVGAPRGPRPMQNPALPRTGSPTMRIVEPSPEPDDDDRAMLPSARPRRVQAPEQSPPQRQQAPLQSLPQGQQARLQSCPFPAPQHRTQPEHSTDAPTSQKRHQQQEATPATQHHHRQRHQQQQQQQPRDTRPQQPHANHPRQEQAQPQSQPAPIPQLAPAQQARGPDAPNWISGLPAHPHPLRRPQHTSTLWLPPQARTRDSRKRRGTIETEPDHHGQSPMRPSRQPAPPRHAPIQPRLHHRRDAGTPPPFSILQQPQDQTPGEPHRRETYIHPRQQHAYPCPDPRPYPDQGPSHHHPAFCPRQQPPQDAFFQQQQQQQRQPPQATIVAKRLGHDRAVDMSISTDYASWASSSRNRHPTSGGPVCPSPEVITPGARSGDLPWTPTWLPRLTPTRRGADLYLNVH